MSHQQRAGLTLIEVLLATAMLAMALARWPIAILRSSRSPRCSIGKPGNANLPAELDCVLAQNSPADSSTSASYEAVASDPSWSRRIAIEPTQTPQLVAVTVEVCRTNSPTQQPIATLTRYMAIHNDAGSGQR